MISCFLSCLRRPDPVDDPFAPDALDRIRPILDISFILVVAVFYAGGGLLFVGGCFYYMFARKIPSAMKWHWPLWGGPLMMVFGVLLMLLLIFIRQCTAKRHDLRLDARRQRRQELLESNRRPDAIVPISRAAIPAAATSADTGRNRLNDTSEPRGTEQVAILAVVVKDEAASATPAQETST
ncbi:hypothetical protein DL93DRAFT_762896 [Clavulina sp. PMI_390]|nr:hypothetical protein DL93DRAFT_762896 [Clavulina sp. PMI_390]